MRCRECNAETEHKLISEDYTRKGSNVVVKVKDIPAEVCPACGENYIELDVLKELDPILEPLLESGKAIHLPFLPVIQITLLPEKQAA